MYGRPRRRSSSSRRRWPRDARRLLGVVRSKQRYPRPSRRLLSQLQMRSARSSVTFRRVASSHLGCPKKSNRIASPRRNRQAPPSEETSTLTGWSDGQHIDDLQTRPRENAMVRGSREQRINLEARLRNRTLRENCRASLAYTYGYVSEGP
jgi:hypothetical protein